MSETEIERIKKQTLNIKEKIETSTYDERVEMLNTLYKKWVLMHREDYTIHNYLDIALHNFDLEPGNLEIGKFEKVKSMIKYKLHYLHLTFIQEENEDPDARNELETKFNKLFKAVVDADNAIQSALFLKSSMTQEDIGSELKQHIFRYSEVDYESNKPYQNLLLYLLEKIKRKQYRRYIEDSRGMCYKSIYTEDGFDTHAWEPAMNIKDFILLETDKNFNYIMWQNLTDSKDNLKSAVAYITSFIGGEFEDLTRDRNVFSFNNGIYLSKIINENGDLTDQFIPYRGPGSKKLGSSIVACKYFKSEYIDFTYNEEKKTGYKDWFDIIVNHCPNLKHVMTYQKWPEEAQRWLCILIGRLLYKIGEFDDWQCLPYLLGQAGTGKSSILLHVIKLLYESADIGILSNNMEKKFGIGALSDKLMYIGPEIKGDLSLEQSEFQSMISGEYIQINKKYELAGQVKWSAPGIVAGNEVPQYTDNAGSITRRIVVFPFNEKIKKGEGDSKLGKKLQGEIVYIIQACNKAYHQAVNENGSRDLWTILPEFFKATKDEMAENTNGLTHYLRSGHLKFGSTFYIKEKLFVNAFSDHCRENHLGNSKWSSQFYTGPFSEYNITMLKNARRKYPNDSTGEVSSGNFICGVDFVDEEPRKEEEEFKTKKTI